MVSEWSKGNKISNEVAVSMLAVIFFVFSAINTITYIGWSSVQTFLSVVERLASVFEMEEYSKITQKVLKPEEANV